MKRLIYTLYFNGKTFCLSRNFKLQSVGDVNWLHDNYGFGKTSHYIDELIILNVCREHNKQSQLAFAEAVNTLTRDIFIPLSLGGGIRTLEDAHHMFSIGADKIILNTTCFDKPHLLNEISDVYGSQSLICSIDLSYQPSKGYSILTESATKEVAYLETIDFKHISNSFGELMVHSIDRDGTGEGFDFRLAEILHTKNLANQIIFSGGAGKPIHFSDLMIAFPWISATATGNLFNFLGTGLKDARELLIQKGIPLPDFNFKND